MLLEMLAWFALLLAAPGATYLALLTLGAALPRRERVPLVAEQFRAAGVPLAVVVPAHDEASGIARTLRSLRADAASDPLARIVVVADNCSDATAEVARREGAEVIERTDLVRRGKGYALQHAFATIRGVDAFIVVDADTDVEPGFLAAMRRGLAGGASALQCRYGVRDAHASRRALLADVALGAWNTLRPRGRGAMGLSAGILGNGFALTRATLERVPYDAHGIVEDAEYHLMLVRAGLKVRWVDDAMVRGDMPVQAAAAASQRARWEGGRLRLLLDEGPRLLGEVLRGRLALADALADLATPPLAWLVSLLVAAACIAPGQPAGLLALGGLAVVGAHVLLALRLIGAGRAHVAALAGVAPYIVWKLLLAGRSLASARRDATWTRSSRQTR